MTVFITWTKAIDSDFRVMYPTVSEGGETIQEQPAENDTHFMVGTVRLDSAGQSAITAVFGGNVVFSEEPPEGFGDGV